VGAQTRRASIESRIEESRMDRRTFLKMSAALPAVSAMSQVPGVLSIAAAQQKEFNPRPGTWRAYEVTTRVEIVKPLGGTRVWIPLPAVEADYQTLHGNKWSGNAKVIEPATDPVYGAGMLYAEWPADEKAPVLEVVSRFQTQDRAIDWSKKTPARLDPAVARKWTQPTDLMPTDGIVKDTADEITQGKKTDLEKTQAVYGWILANTYRDPKVRGCGVGDIKAMLETKNFGGKCADLNGLFVGLTRAAGVPARDVYGIRVAPSAFGYRSLGAGSANISKAQHCRAEVFLPDHGWVAMDPADVAKAAREETSEWVKLDHPLIAPVRPKLFGGWEGNWLAYNVAHDVNLPHAQAGKIGFLMYPQAETAEGRRDSLDPDTFKYTITTRALGA
jgi:transglutaminase-like putative cysteine protease